MSNQSTTQNNQTKGDVSTMTINVNVNLKAAAKELQFKNQMEQQYRDKSAAKHLAKVQAMFKKMVSQRGAKESAMLNPMNTTATVLARLAESAGVHEETKNFALITQAMVQGYNLIDILNNPVKLAGIPANQVHWIEKFVEANPLPKSLIRPTRLQIKTTTTSVHMAEDVNGRVFAPVKLDKQSQSAMSDIFAKKAVEDVITGKLVADMTHVAYVNLAVELPEDGEMDDETKALVDLQAKMIREGFYVMDEEGNERHYQFFIQTASQARLLQAIFIDSEFMTIPQAMRALGHDFKAYGKKKFIEAYGQEVWVLDITKMLKRFGLSGTSTVESRVVSFPNARVVEGEEGMVPGEYKIASDRHSIYVAEDRFVEIINGEFKAFYNKRIVNVKAVDGVFTATWTDAEGKEVAEVLPMKKLTMAAGDGMLLCDEEIYSALMAEFGERSDAWQIRLTPFGKGLMVFVPGLRNYYDANIVAFKSAVKGDFRQIVGKHEIALRIARFNPGVSRQPVYTVFPYQFAHATSLTFTEMWSMVLPHLERALTVADDEQLIQKYAGVAHLENLEGLTGEEAEKIVDKSIVSTFAAFMHYAPFSHKDVYMQRSAFNLIRDEIAKWEAGTIPVEGHYRFMVQDPYALLDAKKYQQRDEEGQLIIPSHVGLKADRAFMFDRKGAVITDHVALFRNPAIAKGEARLVKGSAPFNYIDAVTLGAFQNLCVMSVHDINAYAMGGADFDGDTCLTVTEKTIVNNLLKKYHVPVLDLYISKGEFKTGCPYPMNAKEALPALGAPCLDQDGFTITFSGDQYTDEFMMAVHELSKEFVIRTMKPNKIGQLTNIATKLADAVRKMGYMITEGKDTNGYPMAHTEESKATLVAEIKKYEYMIDLIRLCQGWEIDRAKHGGAYEEELAMELDFIKNPPFYASYENKKTKKRVWNKPEWLEIHKGRAGGVNTNSVLAKLSNAVRIWVQENVDKKWEAIQMDIENHNLLHVFKTVFPMDQERFDNLNVHMADIRFSYGYDSAALFQETAEKIKVADLTYNMDQDLLDMKKAEIEVERKEKFNALVDKYAALVTALEAAYTPEEIAYVAYRNTYEPLVNQEVAAMNRADNKLKGLGFVWQVCKNQMLTLCSKIANREFTTKKFAVEASEVTLNFRIADRVTNVAKLVACIEDAGVIHAAYAKEGQSPVVTVNVNGTDIYCGDFYKNQADYFTGAQVFKLAITSITPVVTEKSRYMKITVSAIERM
jgi:hypothetical protein